jgi:hypothetical protein
MTLGWSRGSAIAVIGYSLFGFVVHYHWVWLCLGPLEPCRIALRLTAGRRVPPGTQLSRLTRLDAGPRLRSARTAQATLLTTLPWRLPNLHRPD